MKKLVIIIALLLVSLYFVKAQRMLPRQKAIEASGGLITKSVDKDYWFNLTFTVNAKGGDYWLWRGEYSHQLTDYRSLTITVESYTGEIGYSLNLMSNTRRNIALNAGILAIAGYETINKGDSILFDGAKIISRDSFIYGGGLDLSIETYLSDHFVFVLHGRSKLIWGTDLKLFRPSAGLGLRYNF